VSDILFDGLEYAIKSVQANQNGLKLNSTHQLLIYADDVNILGGSIHTIKKNTEVLAVVIKEIGLEVPADKIEVKRQLGRHRRRREYNIKTNLQEVGLRGRHGRLHLFTITEVVVTVLTIVISKSNEGSSPSRLYKQLHSLLPAAGVQTVAPSEGRDISITD